MEARLSMINTGSSHSAALPIHSLELKELVLHQRLEAELNTTVETTICLQPGRINVCADLMTYPVISAAQVQLSTAKTNFKRLVRAYATRWKKHGIKVDVGINFGESFGKRRYMVASLPDHHATRLEFMFKKCLKSQGVYGLFSETFDPYIVVAREPWLFEIPQDS